MAEDPLNELLTKLCSGDDAAAEEVFRAYEPFLRKAVRRQLPARLRAKFDSLDIVQSVWANVLHGFREAGWRFTDADHLRAFLLKATRNRFIDRVRRHRSALDREEPLGPKDLAEFAPSVEPRPSEVVQERDLWQQMLSRCPPEHHELLTLKRQGYSLTEVAEKTGLHVDSVRRILRKLARQMAFPDDMGEPG